MDEVDTNGDGVISRQEFIEHGGTLFPDTDIVGELKGSIAEGMGEMGGDDDCTIM